MYTCPAPSWDVALCPRGQTCRAIVGLQVLSGPGTARAALLTACCPESCSTGSPGDRHPRGAGGRGRAGPALPGPAGGGGRGGCKKRLGWQRCGGGGENCRGAQGNWGALDGDSVGSGDCSARCQLVRPCWRWGGAPVSKGFFPGTLAMTDGHDEVVKMLYLEDTLSNLAQLLTQSRLPSVTPIT